MWYAMQVKGGNENLVSQLCKARFQGSLLNNCFYPKREIIRKERGERKVVMRTMFPGYLIIDSDTIDELSRSLWQVPELTKVIKTGTTAIPIEGDEREFIERHSDQNHVFRMSKGYMVGDFVKIEEGAFAGFYGRLLYVNRHNRFGVMKIHMFGKEMEIQFGLEIVHKIPSPTQPIHTQTPEAAGVGVFTENAWHSYPY